MTNMTGNMNLKSSAKQKYNPIYMDGFVFAFILFLDANKLVKNEYIASAYMYIGL